jgi:hypothetical protein
MKGKKRVETRRGGAKGSVREKIIEIRKNKNGKVKTKEHV